MSKDKRRSPAPTPTAQERLRSLLPFLYGPEWQGLEGRQRDDGPIQLTGGAIVSGCPFPGLGLWYEVTTYSYSGPRKFAGVSFDAADDVQSETPRRAASRAWSYGVDQADLEREQEKVPPTAESVLATLRDASSLERLRQTILEAEVIEFTADQAIELNGLLLKYIGRYHGAKDELTLVSVGAAIRSYAALLPAARFDEIAGLLSFTEPLPSLLENEVAKMTVRKLTANPPACDEPYPKLAEQLADLADSFMKPRILPRDCCGPAAMNAALATAIMRTPRFLNVIECVQSLNVAWFRKQLGRRADRLSLELTAKFPLERVSAQRDALARLRELGEA